MGEDQDRTADLMRILSSNEPTADVEAAHRQITHDIERLQDEIDDLKQRRRRLETLFPSLRAPSSSGVPREGETTQTILGALSHETWTSVRDVVARAGHVVVSANPQNSIRTSLDRLVANGFVEKRKRPGRFNEYRLAGGGR